MIYHLSLEDFKNDQVAMMQNAYSNDQIKDNVKRYLMHHFSPNLKIDTYMDLAMDVYGEILLRHSHSK